MKMHEILFLGDNTYNCKCEYGSLLSTDEFNENPHIVYIDYLNEYGDIGEISTPVIPETVGQFTGLTDKNGKRIFEEDIVKGIAYSVERIGVIVWIDEIASFGVRYFKSVNSTAWENSSILHCASMGKTDEFAAEIIGNIHDNPELLKGGEGDG